MFNYIQFLESLETNDNKSTINAIKEGYIAFEASYQPEVHFGGETQRVFTELGKLLDQYGYIDLVSAIDVVVNKLNKANNANKKMSIINEFRELVDEEIFNAPDVIQFIDSKLSELIATF